MKKLDVRNWMLDFAWVIEFSIFRVFELFDLCGFLNFYLCLFLWWGIEEGVVEKLCLNLSTTPNRLAIQ